MMLLDIARVGCSAEDWLGGHSIEELADELDDCGWPVYVADLASGRIAYLHPEPLQRLRARLGSNTASSTWVRRAALRALAGCVMTIAHAAALPIHTGTSAAQRPAEAA